MSSSVTFISIISQDCFGIISVMLSFCKNIGDILLKITRQILIIRVKSIIIEKKESENMIKFICYPKCTTCQRALAWLNDKGAECEIRNIKEQNPSYEELKAWYEASGLAIKRFFNTSGLLYKSMNLKDKLDTMTTDEKLALLATDGMLVKRPIAVGEDFVLVGFKEDEWCEKLST